SLCRSCILTILCRRCILTILCRRCILTILCRSCILPILDNVSCALYIKKKKYVMLLNYLCRLSLSVTLCFLMYQ
ncbi:hypothetical protein LDENG_00024910, partial [Lucifuga dentata]